MQIQRTIGYGTRLFIQLLMVAGVVLAALPSVDAKMNLPKLTADQKDRLETGEILVNMRETQPHNATTARVIGIIEAAPAKVWKHIDNCSKYKEFMPRVIESYELSREGDNVMCRTVVDLPFPMGKVTTDMKSEHTDFGDNHFRRRWKTVAGPYYVHIGSWQLFPWSNGRTLAVYNVKVAPKMEVPTKLRNAAQKITLPKLIKSVRQRVKTG